MGKFDSSTSQDPSEFFSAVEGTFSQGRENLQSRRAQVRLQIKIKEMSLYTSVDTLT